MLGIYIRVSKRKKEGEDTSKITQLKKGIALANSLKLDWVKYEDDGISGTKEEISDRPEFAKMLIDIEKKKITAVYTQYQDRLERNSDVWNLFKTIILKNGCGWYPSGIKTDLKDPQAVFTAQIMSASNALYAALTGSRVKESIRRRAEEGKFRGLKAYGYMQDRETGKLIINTEEAKVIRRIFKESLDGIGVWHIATGLNNDKIQTRYQGFEGVTKRKDPFTGKVTEHNKKNVRWRGNVVHDIIKNPIYKGEKWIKDVMYPVDYIIEPEIWDKVNNNLTANKKNVGKKTQYKYLLNDLIICSSCGRKFVGKKRIVSSDNSYKCKGKIYPHPECSNSRGVNINKLDSFILKHLFIEKTLKELLLSIPQDNTLVLQIEAKLKKERVLLERKKREKQIAFDNLYDEVLKDDPDVKQRYSKVKKEFEVLTEKVKRLEKSKEEAEPIIIKKRTENLLSQYVEGLEFNEVKRLVHGLIDWIRILHHKEEGKIGNFLIEIKYLGYDEVNTFITNWTATKWFWLSRYRNNTITEDDLIQDKQDQEALDEYYGLPKDKEGKIKSILEAPNLTNQEKIKLVDSINADFNGYEVVQSMHKIIELSEKDMIYFE
jgi:site-specific DNA recombinase